MKIFDRLFSASDRYLKKCRWTDMALLKFCLCAIGILIGIGIPHKDKKAVGFAAGLVFIATYIPLMAKFVPYLLEGEKEETCCEE